MDRTGTRTSDRRRQRGRGFALPVVLLVLAAMSAMALRMVEESRGGIAVARARLGEAVARNAADAGYEMFLTRYAEAQDGTAPAFDTRFGVARIAVRAEAESGKVDINIGAPELIESVLRAAGAEDARAREIAGGIALVRGDGGVFHAVDELMRVPGMDFELLARVRPYVTVYFAAPGVDPRSASREVLMAMPGVSEATADRIIAARDGEGTLDREERVALRAFRSRGRPVFTVLSTATLADGSSYTREAVVDLSDPGAPLILDWGRANAAPAGAAVPAPAPGSE